MINSAKLIVALFIISFSFSVSGYAQCKSQIKAGIKTLSPYTHNGQVNSAKLAAGQTSQFHISVYKGLSYRFQVVSDLSNVQFKVYDENKNEIYSNMPNNTGSWEFTSSSSQELIVEIVAADKTQSGCVGVVVGMQQPKNYNNPIRNL